MHLAEKIFGSPAALATRRGKAADARLVFQCNLIDIALRGLDVCTTGAEVHAIGAVHWVGRINTELKAFNAWQQRLAPVVGESAIA